MLGGITIHPTALVETEAIGEHTRIWAYVHVMPNVVIGRDCNIGDHCFIETGARIGSNVTIKNGNMIWDGITLEDGVFVGPSVCFTNDLYPRSPRLLEARARYSNRSWLRHTVVRQGDTVGAGAVILAGITIGDYAMVGAGSVVTREVPPQALVVGNPARIRGWMCYCGLPLTLAAGGGTCTHCDRRFARTENGVHALGP